MSIPTVLTQTQKLFLELFSKREISQKFYLSGGTALAGFYIPYRYSEDLDFFSLEEVRTEPIVIFIRSIKDQLGFDSLDFNTSFNRNLFFLRFPTEELKLEFTYYPFQPLYTQKEEYGVKIDSLDDIAVNKLLTIYQNPRSRDFMDLYMIMKARNFSIEELIKKAKLKFDWHVDPLKLGSQFLLVDEVKDYPMLLTELDESVWQDFFKEEAKKLKTDIFDKNNNF